MRSRLKEKGMNVECLANLPMWTFSNFRAGALTQCAQTPAHQVQTFLRRQLQFSDREVDDVENGKPVAKVLPSERQEVAVFGNALVRGRRWTKGNRAGSHRPAAIRPALSGRRKRVAQ
jgi:hypothetical protein